MRTELVDRYRSLALPTTRDEHWRFTNLEGFDPDAWTADASSAGAVPSMLDLDVAATATIDESGISVSEVSAAGVRFEPLTDDHPLLGSLVKPDDKLRAHNAAVWEHGLLVHVPAGSSSRSRCTCASRAACRVGRSSGACSSSPSRARGSRSSRSSPRVTSSSSRT